MNINDLQNNLIRLQEELIKSNLKKKLDNILTSGAITILIGWGIIGNYTIPTKSIILNEGFLIMIKYIGPLYISHWVYLLFELGIFFYMPLLIITLFGNHIKNFEKNISGLYDRNELILKIATKVNSLEEILSLSKEIGYTINNMRKYGFSKSIVLKKTLITDIDVAIKMEVYWLNLVLSDLRSDLSIRLAEQQKTLEQAKSEVEQNIHGTTELNQVSELQKARLDRQIEQFEELQRVLVKV